MKHRSPEETYGPALEKAVRDLQSLDPWLAALRSYTKYTRLTDTSGQIEVRFWGKDYLVHYPEISVQELETEQEPPIAIKILILHYLINADGTPLADAWVSFRELPDGHVYDAAFRRRANLRLAQAFGSDLNGFVAAAKALGGEHLTYGDASFLFPMFPCVQLAAVLYLADDEFPASANVLFDAAAGHYLPTEDLAVLGGMLAGQLIKAGGGRICQNRRFVV
jgi:hypothetical protein